MNWLWIFGSLMGRKEDHLRYEITSVFSVPQKCHSVFTSFVLIFFFMYKFLA